MFKGITYISAAKKAPVNRKIHIRSMKKIEHTGEIPKVKPDVRVFAGRMMLVCFLCGIVMGTLFVNLFCGGEAEQFGIYNEYFMKRFLNFEVDKKSLFLYSFVEHWKEILLLLAVGFTSVGTVAAGCFLIYKGMTVGVLISVYVQQYGMGGILLYLLSVFPHGIPYILLVVVLISLNREIYMDRKQLQVLKGKKILAYLKCLFILLVLTVLTAYLETFVNVGMMQKFFLM